MDKLVKKDKIINQMKTALNWGLIATKGKSSIREGNEVPTKNEYKI